LRDLAAAFDINIDRDATKAEILPVLIAAESRGVFRHPERANQALLRRAGWAHGEGKYPGEEIEELEARDTAPITGVLYKGSTEPGLRVGLKDFQALTRRAKEIDPGMSTYGMKSEDLRAFIEKREGASDVG
jgi:hypothetical protein